MKLQAVICRDSLSLLILSLYTQAYPWFMTQGDAHDAAQIGVRLTLTRRLQRVQWPGRGKAVLCPLHWQWPVDFKVTRPGVVLWGSGSEFARSCCSDQQSMLPA